MQFQCYPDLSKLSRDLIVLIFLEFTDKAKVNIQGKPSECVTHLREEYHHKTQKAN